MSTTTVDVLARLRADTSNFKSGMNQAAGAAGGLNSKVGGHIAQMGAKFQQLATTAATAMSAAIGVLAVPALLKGYERMTTIQDSTVAIGVALGDTAKAAKLLDDVLAVVRGTPFNFDQFASAAQQMVGMGVETEKIPRYLTAIGEASATQGKRANEYAGRLATVFGQISAANRIMGDDVQSFQEVGVNALAILGNSFGVTTSEMRDMISKGLVPATAALDILSDGIMNGSDGVNGATVSFAGTMAGLRKTLTGAIGGVGAAVARLGAAFLTPLSPVFIAAANTATSALDKLAVYAKKLGAALAESKAMKVFISYLEKIPDKIGPILDGMNEMKSTLAPVLGLILAMASTNVAAAFGPLGAIIPNISPLVGILLGLATQSAPLREAFMDLMAAMQPVIKSLMDALMPIMDQLGGLISSTLAPALVELAPPFIELLAAFIPLLPPLIELAKVIIPILTDALLIIVSEGIVPLIDKLVPVLTGFVDWTAALGKNKDAVEILTPLVVGLIVAFVGFKTAAFVSGVITGITAAMTGLNAALLANPVGMVIVAIVLLAAYIYILWTQWDKIWGWIMSHKAYAAIIFVLMGPIFQSIFVTIAIIKFLWKNWDTIWGWISEKAMWAWGYIKIAFNAIAGFVTETLVPIFLMYWETMKTVWNGISAVVMFAWNSILFPIFKGIHTWIMNNLIPASVSIWEAFQIAWDVICNVIMFAWNNIIQPIWDSIQWYIGNILVPMFNLISTVVSTVFNVVGTVIGWVWSNVISPTFGWISDAIGTLLGVFNTIKDGIQTAFSAVFDVIVSPFKLAFNTIARIWNATVGKLTVSTPDIPGTDFGGIDIKMPTIPTWEHSGGLVAGSMSSQNVPAMLQAGELVVSRAQLGALERGTVPGGTIGDRGAVYNINVNVAAGADKAAIGQSIVESIAAYERRSGSNWRAA